MGQKYLCVNISFFNEVSLLLSRASNPIYTLEYKMCIVFIFVEIFHEKRKKIVIFHKVMKIIMDFLKALHMLYIVIG